MTRSINSDELNYFVYRYLKESGFEHTAFCFGFESGMHKSSIDGNTVPIGALVTFLQKGLQYLDLEANHNDDDTVPLDEEAFVFNKPFDLITKTDEELRQMVKDNHKNKPKQEENQEKEKDVVKDKPKRKRKLIIEDDDEEEDVKDLAKAVTPINISTPSTSTTPVRILNADVMNLKGHTSEVYTCAWHPSCSLLASGSRDSTARIWTIPDWTDNRFSVLNRAVKSVELKHSKGRTKEKNKDVTTIEWNLRGTALATGSFDGQAKIWTPSGVLKCTLDKHKGPVNSIKWNKKGDYVVTGSSDKTTIVWDVNENLSKQQFKFHKESVLDVDWRNNNSFASCSTDHMIYVCKLGENKPLKSFFGHKREVNCVKWDPAGALLASCSRDTTAKIWSMMHEKLVHNLQYHTKEVNTIRWSPTGHGTDNPNKQLMLACASNDSVISLWEAESGKKLRHLKGHSSAIQALSWSPNGEYLASGAVDRCLHIWSVKDGKIIKSYNANGAIFDVCWNKEGDRIGLCTKNNTVSVVDLNM